MMALPVQNMGFPVSGAYSWLELQYKVLNHGSPVYTPDCLYQRYAPGEGIEVWSKPSSDGDYCHLYPHFLGDTRIRIALVEKRPSETFGRADGLFVAYFNPKVDEGLEAVHERLRYGNGKYTGVLPFVFSVPNYSWYSKLEMPILTYVHIAAFPLLLHAFETEDDWIDSQLEDKGDKEDKNSGYFRGASFIPSPAFFEKESPDDFPEPTAILSGIVLETAINTNPVTGKDFSWAKIETAAGDMDLVVNPELLDGYLVEGGVAAGNCYLSGRLPEFAPDI
ncbi:MAG: hypothetical protein M3362_24085 [Acidobacteriota bacterium]|nr:hypothetical protein [Acidobacteriota bacterium]